MIVITQLTGGGQQGGGPARAGKDEAGGASTGQGGARAGKDRAGGEGRAGRAGQGEARRVHYAPCSH